ncbi:hypothetical protein N9800_01175 [bacterium]|nr:hypothetical protein [bacterium]
MKATKQLVSAIVLALLLFSTTTILAQDDAPKTPEYYTVTTMYWNSENDSTMDEWKAVEKEYLDKVTSKNEFVMGGWYYTHLLTENSNEVLYVQSYPNWEALDKAASRSSELEKEAWPDEEARNAFLKNMNSAFSSYHSDEIFATLPGATVLPAAPEGDMVLYMRQNKLAFPEDGTDEEFNSLRKKITDNVINKNDYIKGYYPSMHAWGSDKRDFNEGILLNSLDDLSKMFDRNAELMEEALTEEESKALGKYFKGHGDYVYTAVKL